MKFTIHLFTSILILSSFFLQTPLSYGISLKDKIKAEAQRAEERARAEAQRIEEQARVAAEKAKAEAQRAEEKLKDEMQRAAEKEQIEAKEDLDRLIKSFSHNLADEAKSAANDFFAEVKEQVKDKLEEDLYSQINSFFDKSAQELVKLNGKLDSESGKLDQYIKADIEKIQVKDKQAIQEKVKSIMKEVENKWINKNGFLLLNPIEGDVQNAPLDNENPVLFTAQYYFLLKKLGGLDSEEIYSQHKNRISYMIDSLRLERGLFDRDPVIEREYKRFVRSFSRDEQIGLVTLGTYVFNDELDYAQELVDYGHEHTYIYNNRAWNGPGDYSRPLYRDETGKGMDNDLETKAAAYRTPEFIYYIKKAASNAEITEYTPIVCGGYLHSQGQDKNETSGRILGLLRMEILANTSNPLLKLCLSSYVKDLKQKYGENYYHELAKIYFLNENHPIRRLTKLLE